MISQTDRSKFAPGFRLSLLDAVVLVAGVAGTVGLANLAGWAGLVVGLVVGHFFLFCNVFRIARKLELIWTAVFIPLTVGAIQYHFPNWPVALSVIFGATIICVAVEMRKPSYHGVGWKWINPKLPEWWKTQNF